MKEIINFESARIATELNKFQRYKTIPISFLNGTYTIENVKKVYNELSKKHQRIADKFLTHFPEAIQDNEKTLFENFIKEYTAFINDQRTRDQVWEFPIVMSRWRKNINPVRALLYDAREIVKSYNSEDPRHIWMHAVLTENEFHNRLLDAIITDRKRVDKILNHYLPLYAVSGISEPFQMIHLKRLRSDLLEYANTFAKFKTWDPD